MVNKTVPRNFVKKHMETFNKPKTHKDKTKYRRLEKHQQRDWKSSD